MCERRRESFGEERENVGVSTSVSFAGRVSKKTANEKTVDKGTKAEKKKN